MGNLIDCVDGVNLIPNCNETENSSGVRSHILTVICHVTSKDIGGRRDTSAQTAVLHNGQWYHVPSTCAHGVSRVRKGKRVGETLADGEALTSAVACWPFAVNGDIPQRATMPLTSSEKRTERKRVDRR